MSKSHSETKKKAVWDKTGGKCWFCGCSLTPYNLARKNGKVSSNAFVIDHAIPRGRGGGNHIDNLFPSCQSCNLAKGNKNIDEYRKHLAFSTSDVPYFSDDQIAWLKSIKVNFDFSNFIAQISFWGERQEEKDSFR